MTRPPTTDTIHARVQPGGRGQIDARGLSVPFDASWAAEPAASPDLAELPGPAALLASALAACMLGPPAYLRFGRRR